MTNQKRKGRATYEPCMEPARVTEWKGFDRFNDLGAVAKISSPSSSADTRLNDNGSTKRRAASDIDGETHWNLDSNVFVPGADIYLSRSPSDSFSTRSTKFSSSRSNAYGTNRRASRDVEPTYLPADRTENCASGRDTFGLDSLARLYEMLGEMDEGDTATSRAAANDSGVEQHVGNGDVSDSRGGKEPRRRKKLFETRSPKKIRCIEDLRVDKMLQRREIMKCRSHKKEVDELINTRCFSREDLFDAFNSLKKTNKNAQITMWDIVEHLSTSLNIAKEDMRLEFNNRYFIFNEKRFLNVKELIVEDPTTMVVRNIPRHQKRDQLEKRLEKTGFPCGIAYNFLYLPYSLHSGQNLGYAFINFVTTELASDFSKKWNKQRLMGSNLKSRPLNVSVAQVQGQDANLDLVQRDSKAYKLTGPKLQPIVCGPDGVAIDVSRLYFEKMKSAGKPPEDIVRPDNTIPKNKKSLGEGSQDLQYDEDSESA